METRILVGTAVSGGSLRGLLEEAIRKYGAQRLALQVETLAMDFLLPSPTGCGVSLTREALARLREKHAADVFFSEALCARYFTYRDGRGAHLVLFDDAQTVERKLALARSLGIRDAFTLYPAEL